MSLAIPVTNGHMTAGAQSYAPGSGSAPPPVEASVASMQGTGPLGAVHNTPLHVAMLGGLALIVIVGLHQLGFRFAFDVGMGR